MKEVRGKTVLVTGAASGIGRETALAFAREGSVVLLADIDFPGLESLTYELESMGSRVRAYRVDVSDAGEVSETARQLEEEFGVPDVLVNNAGVFVWGDLVDTTLEDWRWLMGVNLWGPIHTIREFLPGMMRRGSGHIVNVASGGGLVTVPSAGAYCATKFAVVGMSEALEQEVRENGIGVTTFCPGSTRTPIIKNIRVRNLDTEKLEKKLFPVFNRYPADRTAALIVDAVKRERPLVVTTFGMKFLCYMKRLSPAIYRGVQRPFRRYFTKVAR